jgi:hypothetical protein
MPYRSGPPVERHFDIRKALRGGARSCPPCSEGLGGTNSSMKAGRKTWHFVCPADELWLTERDSVQDVAEI